MMYLIKKNGNYTVNASDRETLKKYGVNDTEIIFSWDEANQGEALKSYFSRMRIEKDILDLCVVSGITKNEISGYIDGYYSEDEKILSVLTDVEVITPDQKDELSDISDESKKRQMDVVAGRYHSESLRKHIR